MVPVPILATGTVPDAILEPLRLVNDAPEPLNVVAVTTPDTLISFTSNPYACKFCV